MGALAGLNPANVWKHFEAFCGIPHCSGNEKGIAAYIEKTAKGLGFATRRDETGNVVVVQPASKGMEKAPTVVIQGHMDMVGVAADGVKHDFLKDPIKCRIDGDFVKATGTTLGADNGIGGAVMLALMEEKDFPHPEIEHFFTVNEEAGMDGAHGLKGDFLKGRRLINLDTEEFGQVYISCAGGGDSVISYPFQRTASKASETLTVAVGGLKGGHSGADIHLGRGSANKIMARLLSAGLKEAEIRIRSMRGGKKRNSIADFAEAVVDVQKDKADAFSKAVKAAASVIKEELSRTDSGFEANVNKTAGQTQDPMSADASRTLVRLLLALPHGVQAMSPEVPGLVETSTNVGTIESDAGNVKIVLLSRSAVTSALNVMKEKIRAIADLAGAAVTEPKGYPGWKPDMNSRLLKIALSVFKEKYGKEPQVKAIHAGLECGLFSEKLKGVEMISIGPDMADVHSPAERLKISSVPEFYNYMKSLMAALK